MPWSYIEKSALETMAGCPFCGGKDLVLENHWESCLVQCQPCLAEGPLADTERDAVVKWNNRACVAQPVVEGEKK